MSQKMDSLTDGKLAAASHYAAPMLPKERDNAKAFTGKKSGVATKEPDPSLVRFRRCNARGGDAAKQCRGWPKIILKQAVGKLDQFYAIDQQPTETSK
jgi:hypothetical protein